MGKVAVVETVAVPFWHEVVDMLGEVLVVASPVEGIKSQSELQRSPTVK